MLNIALATLEYIWSLLKALALILLFLDTPCGRFEGGQSRFQLQETSGISAVTKFLCQFLKTFTSP